MTMPQTDIAEEVRNSFAAWPPNWRAQRLNEPPMIAPARQFTYPLAIAGEEDALTRGALHIQVHPESGGMFLATCALGFSSSSMPTEVFACPNPEEICAVAGGYAYIIDASRPERCTHLPLKPVVSVRVLQEQGLLLFVGFQYMMAWGANGLVWKTERLSWEGIRLGDLLDNELFGFGWRMQTDKEVSFAVNLLTGEHTGGGF